MRGVTGYGGGAVEGSPAGAAAAPGGRSWRGPRPGRLARDAVYVRHSRHPGDVVIHYTHAEWDAFTNGVKAGEFHPGSR
ncbi:MAG: DUF397 domain-containing protein [Pseudonocardiaceae bacterium]